MNFIQNLIFAVCGERGLIKIHSKNQPQVFLDSFVKWRLEDTIDYIEDNEVIGKDWEKVYGKDLLSRVSFYSPEWLPSMLDIKQAEEVAKKIIEDTPDPLDTTEPCDVVYPGRVEKVLLHKPRDSPPFVAVKYSHPSFRYYETKMLNEKWNLKQTL